MKDLKLKQPTACCGKRSMAWNGAKDKFVCACGNAKADIYGRPIKVGKRQGLFMYGKGKQAFKADRS